MVMTIMCGHPPTLLWVIDSGVGAADKRTCAEKNCSASELLLQTGESFYLTKQPEIVCFF